MLLNTAKEGRQTGPHRVRSGSGAGRQEPGTPPCARAQRLYRGAGPRGRRQLTRFRPFRSQCRAGNVKIRRGSWNEELFRVLEGFPDLAHDEEVDACSGALEMLNPAMKGEGHYEWMRQRAEAIKEQHKPQPAKPAWGAPPG